MAQRATIRPLLGHDTARRPAIRLGAHTTRGARDTARSALGWEQGCDIKVCIVAEAGRPWVAIRRHCAAIQRSSRPRHNRGSALGARACARQYGRAKPATRPGQACDTARPGLRHGQARPATRRSVHARCAQAGQCVHTVHLTLF